MADIDASGFTRREVIAKALVAGAGATLVGLPLAPSADAASSQGSFDPSFISGQILTKKGSGSAALLEDVDRVRPAHIGARTHVWKHGAWGKADLATGDCLYGTGYLDQSGTFFVERVWVAIESFAGPLVDVENGRLTLQRREVGNSLDVRVDRHTLVQNKAGHFIQNASTTKQFAAGDWAHVIGYTDRATEQFTASRIYRVLDNGTHSGGEHEPVKGMPFTTKSERGLSARPLVDCPLMWSGLASFFCCGNVSGCGYSCGSSGAGWCTNETCRSYNHQMAWTHISQGSRTCQASCQGCCGSGSMAFACGKNASLANPCNSKTDVATLVDCGPNWRCVPAFGCDNRTGVKFDLTPCTFAALGGDFASGFVTCDATLVIQC